MDENAFFAAIERDREDDFSLLLSGREIDIYKYNDTYSNSPLTFAAQENKKWAIEMMHNHGFDVYKEDEVGNTAMMCAVSFLSNDAITFLVNNGGPLGEYYDDGDTFLEYLINAALIGDERSDDNVIKMLINAGSNLHGLKPRSYKYAMRLAGNELTKDDYRLYKEKWHGKH